MSQLFWTADLATYLHYLLFKTHSRKQTVPQRQAEASVNDRWRHTVLCHGPAIPSTCGPGKSCNQMGNGCEVYKVREHQTGSSRAYDRAQTERIVRHRYVRFTCAVPGGYH